MPLNFVRILCNFQMSRKIKTKIQNIVCTIQRDRSSMFQNSKKPAVEFDIKRKPFDNKHSTWYCKSFVYNGNTKRVTVSINFKFDFSSWLDIKISNYLILERYGMLIPGKYTHPSWFGFTNKLKDEYKMSSPTPHMLIRTLLQKCIFACNRSPYFM